MEPTMQSEQPIAPKQESGVGAVIGSIIIILLIIGGAFYLFAQIKDKVGVEKTQEQMTEEAPATTEELEAELQTIDTAELDAELKEIEAQF